MKNKEPNLRQRYRAFRKWLLEFTPFVKRKRYRRIVKKLEEEFQEHQKLRANRHGELPKFLLSASALKASRANQHELINFRNDSVEELCLFVTFAARTEIKQHVIDHVTALLEENIAVILIVNTDHPHTVFTPPEEIASRLFGVMVRENKGFDFAAWAHAFSKLDSGKVQKRLYLINDSLVGPLDKKAYSTMIASIRSARGDCVGLTGNADPRWHLQSFFLAINEDLLHSTCFKDFMLDVLNLPTKQDVIDVYETGLTEHIQDAGYHCETVFPYLAPNRHSCNDTIHSWEKLVEIGFPFIKASIIREQPNHPDVLRLVPPEYRQC